jgi:hypothetical protein
MLAIPGGLQHGAEKPGGKQDHQPIGEDNEN